MKNQASTKSIGLWSRRVVWNWYETGYTIRYATSTSKRKNTVSTLRKPGTIIHWMLAKSNGMKRVWIRYETEYEIACEARTPHRANDFRQLDKPGSWYVWGHLKCKWLGNSRCGRLDESRYEAVYETRRENKVWNRGMKPGYENHS